nr:hypothetical protein [Tanacetum cinerariifolium]
MDVEDRQIHLTGNSFTCDPIPESFDEVQIIPNPPPQCHFNIYLCQICESNSHYGYECSQRVPLFYEPEPCYTQNFSDNDYSHDLLGVNPLIGHHCCYKCGNSLNDFFCHQCTCEFCGNCAHEEEKRIEEEQAAKAQNWKLPVCYNDDDDEDYIVVITRDFPITDSLIMENEHLDTILETKSEKFIKSSVENLVPIPSESGDFFDIKSECDMFDCDDSQTTKFPMISNPLFNDSTFSDDESSNEPRFYYKNDRFDTKSYLLESLLNHDTLMASSPKFDSILEEFFGELAHTDLIPPGINEALYDDHVKEISSGSTTTHFDSSLYDSFIFDHSINLFPHTDRSDFYDFVDELTHIISPPKYDCFCFKIEPNSGDFIMDVVEDTFPTREPRVHNALPTHPTFQLNLDFILSSKSLFAYVVWIFLFFSHIQLLFNIFYPWGMKIPFLISASAVIISLLSCRMYLIGVRLSQNSKS